MPELPEVETVCRVMRRALQGKEISHVLAVRDPLVFSGHTPKAIEKALTGRKLKKIGRLGKYFWLELDGEGPVVFGHLGMSGWIREVGVKGTRLLGHGDAPLDDAQGRPRFLRLIVQTRDGRGVAYTDPRRFGRIWLGSSPEKDRRFQRLGRDAFDNLPATKDLLATFARRKIPIKTVLLDQSVLAGVGNWIADEVLYHSKLSPKRIAASLTKSEVAALRRAIHSVLALAVKVKSDHLRFPKSWLFHHRWGGKGGAKTIGGHPIVREQVGARSTAWVPKRQK